MKFESGDEIKDRFPDTAENDKKSCKPWSIFDVNKDQFL
ncbi:hypothetical protein SAMN05421827_11577 [Pedobacter terrae]|uniref:Uncharacterized protein n=1 Tax=Pedobacter terrae TaxID=405671 RepID=A0A1G7Z596_9SPHI|nr:hypothetical protein SAMN05421827_11577 [Pedobacter terrae]